MLVNRLQLAGVGDQLIQCSEKMESVIASLREQNRILRGLDSYYESELIELNSCIESLEDSVVKENKLGNLMCDILKEYQETEQRIVDHYYSKSAFQKFMENKYVKFATNILQMIGGAAECALGAAICAAGCPILGVPLIAHGAGNFEKGTLAAINQLAGKEVFKEINHTQKFYQFVGSEIGELIDPETGAQTGAAIANNIFMVNDFALGTVGMGTAKSIVNGAKMAQAGAKLSEVTKYVNPVDNTLDAVNDAAKVLDHGSDVVTGAEKLAETANIALSNTASTVAADVDIAGKAAEVYDQGSGVVTAAEKLAESAGRTAKEAKKFTAEILDDVGKGGSDLWNMIEGGGTINGREYSQHAMERMAPDTPQVRAELSRRAENAAIQRGLKVGTQEYYEYCKKYVDPRNIPPSVIEDAISSTKGIPGNRPNIFIHETADIKIVINSAGKVITVIPK